MNQITKDAMLKIEEVLNIIGLNIKFKGYKYWVLAIIIKLKHSKCKLEDIYEILGQKYKVRKSTIASAMSRSVERADNIIIQSYFKVSYQVTPSSLLELINRTVRRQLLEEGREFNG